VKRRLLALVASVAMILVLAPTVLAEYGPCIDSGTNARLAGVNVPSPNGVAVRGVKATIAPRNATAFHTCYPSGQVNFDSSSHWVAIVPGPGNTHYLDGNSILQVGVEVCVAPFGLQGCDGNPHFFWAMDGCGESPYPRPLPNGATNYFQHVYEIRHVSSPVSAYELWIDGSRRFIDDNLQYRIPASDGAINCWIGQGKQQAEFSSEQADGGDSLGDPGTTTIYSAVRYRTTDGQANVSPNWATNANCSFTSSNPELTLHCDISNAVHDQFYTWTTYP
jgi:hypothetical protein